jgi:hypothetical protein
MSNFQWNDNSTIIESETNYKESGFLNFCTITFILAFFIFLCVGFYKLADKSEYVGGDAYNYMINAGKAAALFIVAFGSLIAGILIKILNLFNSRQYRIRDSGAAGKHAEETQKAQ